MNFFEDSAYRMVARQPESLAEVGGPAFELKAASVVWLCSGQVQLWGRGYGVRASSLWLGLGQMHREGRERPGSQKGVQGVDDAVAVAVGVDSGNRRLLGSAQGRED